MEIHYSNNVLVTIVGVESYNEITVDNFENLKVTIVQEPNWIHRLYFGKGQLSFDEIQDLASGDSELFNGALDAILRDLEFRIKLAKKFKI